VSRPLLKQFIDLVPLDLEDHPVWVACHSADYDQPWHDDTDEETFRPWNGELPVDAGDDNYLVAASATLNDGTTVPAFLTPSVQPDDPGVMQPHVFVGEEAFGFWGGMTGIPRAERVRLLERLGKEVGQVFPIRVASRRDLALGCIECDIGGWMKLNR
jgi:hypothetical protein